jgi:hypothetical protein
MAFQNPGSSELMMNAPRWHLRHIEGDFVQPNVQHVPFPSG